MDVRQVIRGFDFAIKSISALYDKHGLQVGPFIHGLIGGGKTYAMSYGINIINIIFRIECDFVDVLNAL